MVFRPEAERDLTEAYGWYEDQRVGLGEEFLSCVEAAIESVKRNPEMYERLHGEVRRVLTRRFPFGIFFIFEGNQIVVISVFHASRDPKKWEDLQ